MRGVMILIDVENVTWAILKQKWLLKGLDPKDEVGREKYVRTNQKNISFTKLVKYIMCNRQREGSSCLVEAYAVALGYLENIETPVKLKIASRECKKSIDDSILIRLFTEELTLLRLFRTACYRTFVVVSGDADYFDIVVSALKAGSNVEIWTTSDNLNGAYYKLQSDFRCRTACYGSLKIVFLESLVCSLCSI